MEQQNNMGPATQPTQNVTFNNTPAKSSKGGVVALASILALVIGAGGTFGVMKAIDANNGGKTNCAETSTNNNQGSTSPEGAPNASDQKYAEDRNAFNAIAIYVDSYYTIGQVSYPIALFPGATYEETGTEETDNNIITTYKYTIGYEDFMARTKALYADSVVDSAPSLDDDWYEYTNCDGSLCLKQYGGLGGIIPMYRRSIEGFKKVSDGVYEQKVYELGLGGDDNDKTYTYRAEFDASGVMTSITKTEE